MLAFLRGSRQPLIAKKADILIRGLADVGIVALVDEATGYQYDRARHALEEILERFIKNELGKWARRFPDEFYEHLFRLKGMKWPSDRNPPQFVGTLTITSSISGWHPACCKNCKTKRLRPHAAIVAISNHQMADRRCWPSKTSGTSCVCNHADARI